ncbi:PBP1A family penicillin-binding protein [bacterium]|nr:PBP1A family penicillin-binding protein [bacterium]
MAKKIHSIRYKKVQKPADSTQPSFIKKALLSFIYIGFIGIVGVLGYLYYLSQNLPTLDDLIRPKYDLPTQIYDRNNELITEFYTKRRVLIPIGKVPTVMKQALLAVEDNRFYSHFGIDPIRMVRALIIDVAKRRWAQGASTLTQQTAKMFLLTTDKKIVRKLKEVLLALRIESQFTKDQILELYLNKTFFGHGAYGIEAAAQGYFSKNTEDLNLAEAAMIAGLPQLPSKWAPTYSIENATKRRNIVLKAMEDSGYITREERIRTAVTPIRLNLNKSLDYNETSYYTEHIRRYLYNKYGKEQLYSGGLKVYTMMDLKTQISAQDSLREGLVDHDRRQGYRGPVKNLLQEVDDELGLYIYSEEKGWNNQEFKKLDDDSKTLADKLYKDKANEITISNHFVIGGNVLGVVTNLSPWTVQVNLGEYEGSLLINSMRWARPVNYEKEYTTERLNDFNDILKVGDVIELEIQDYHQENKEFSLVLTQNPIANGGLFAMDPKNGKVIAMSGGYDFRDSEFNRAIQGKRQTGSAFKTIVYSLALDNSFTTSSMLDDTPFVGEGDGESAYKPENYSKSFKGKMSLREALVHSKNMPSIRLTKELGTEAVIEHARKLGITSDLPEDDLTIVLGSASLTLKEMVVAFGTFANGGKLVQPVFIERIEDREGNVIEELPREEPPQVMSEETAFLMTSILQDVVRFGSGFRAQEINRPSAGKTGTTNNYADAWYIGYIPQLIAGVYIGFDKNQQTLGETETGSRAAAPIWTNFMKQVTDPMAILPFEQPDGINMVKINADSGLMDCDSGGNTKYEYYKAGTEPTQCHRAIAAPTIKNEEIYEFKPNQKNSRKNTFIEEL